MEPSTTRFSFKQSEWIGVALTVAAMVAALIMLGLYAEAGLSWHRQGFLGVLPTRTLEISPNLSLTGEDWPALQADLRPGDQLVSIGTFSRRGTVDLAALNPGDRIDAFWRFTREMEPGDLVRVAFLREGTDTPRYAVCQPVIGAVNMQRCEMSVELGEMPLSDLFGYLGLGWIAAAALWLVMTVLMVRSVRNVQFRYAALSAYLLVIFLAGRFDTISTHRFVPIWLVATCLVGGLLVVFALEFPYRFTAIQLMPPLLLAPMIVALGMGGAATALYWSSDTSLSQASYSVASGLVMLGVLLLLGAMLWRRARSASPVVRNQSTLVIMGLIPSLVPGVLWFVMRVVDNQSLSNLLVFVLVLPVVFPLSAIYAILQVRLVDTDRVITNAILYGLLTGLMVVSYWLLVTGIAAVIARSTRETALSPVMVSLMVLAVALLFYPLRSALQRMIDSIYFRTRRAYRDVVEAFSREMMNAVSLDDVLERVQARLNSTLEPTHVILFVRNLVTYDYEALPDPKTRQRPTDIVFRPDSGLVRYLQERASLLHLEEGHTPPHEVITSRAQLAVLGAPVLVGLRGQRVLNGFLAVGPRLGGAPYLHEDLRFIGALGDQMALAVERAQAVGDLERRVQVQDVLSQVSRALNFAIDFDTLLELIYAQTTRVIDAPCFIIALRDPNLDELEYVFYNVGDERRSDIEGRRWRIGHDLMSQIVRTQQTLRTDDYVRETLARDPRLEVDNPNLKAWMGVPLIADTGGGVMGVMVAATTEPGVTFNDEQLDLFWDIANLASSAIDKIKLFDKTQQRARQLSAINEISNQLSAEMGNVDRLLRMITESAVEILGAEAGSLLLVDEDTGDLEFHVVIGGNEDLVGTRLPAGSGLAGTTVQRGVPIIVNDPSRDARWYGDLTRPADAAPGEPVIVEGTRSSEGLPGRFQSSAILSVPLLVGGRAIGVLQTLNKRDRSIFVQEDADILETFAGQAAIAIENARLFDMTDQQLALRVQELDTMQRIDQELNRTLNLNNVVDITMDWAMRKSGASAGALCILDRTAGDLYVVASYGYEPGSDLAVREGESRTVPYERGVIGRVIRSAQPSLITDVTIDPDYQETLPGCKAQLIVPLFSANQVIGVIILESDQENELDLLDLDFVARLAEHASPAIVNSQLFQEIQRANEAKSEFVSFVAHELRNPMTSMKGYTDLLLKGVVGPVNEQQADFLTTIFNNVNRMENLVSDLNDLTKQQTGNMRLDIAPISFRNVITETLRSQQRQIEDKEQELDIRIAEDLPLVLGDQNRLIQIMTNFVSNAYKYTPPGGTITIFAEQARNTWDPQGPPQVVHCYVKDTGIGMDEEDLRKLFTPYFRSENPKTREQPGTGLGLSITKGLIEQHGGTIWVESTPDVGTTFHFTIPVATNVQAERA